MKGLVIRYCFDKWALCDGKCLDGNPEPGELYLGNVVAWFATYKEAENAREVVKAAYAIEV